MTANETFEIFSPQEKAGAFRQKRILFYSWLTLLIIVAGVILTLMIINAVKVNTDYDRSIRLSATVISTVLSAAFAILSMFFFAIKYRLTRKYCRMLREIDSGLKDSAAVTFLKYDYQTVSKDGVYFYIMIVDSTPLRRGDITERHILVEHTVKPPEFAAGQKLYVTTHANILVSYAFKGEVLKRQENADSEKAPAEAQAE